MDVPGCGEQSTNLEGWTINSQNDSQKQQRMGEGWEHLFPIDPVSLKIFHEKK